MYVSVRCETTAVSFPHNYPKNKRCIIMWRHKGEHNTHTHALFNAVMPFVVLRRALLHCALLYPAAPQHVSRCREITCQGMLHHKTSCVAASRSIARQSDMISYARLGGIQLQRKGSHAVVHHGAAYHMVPCRCIWFLTGLCADGGYHTGIHDVRRLGNNETEVHEMPEGARVGRLRAPKAAPLWTTNFQIMTLHRVAQKGRPEP